MKPARKNKLTLQAIKGLSRTFVALLRAAAVLAMIALVVAAVGARRAYGKVSEAALSVGRQLSGLEDLTGRSYGVLLNGQKVRVASSLSEASIDDVLGRFEQHCKDGSVVGDELGVMAKALAESGSPADPSAETSVLRRQAGDDGIVACLVRSDGQRSLTERLSRFAETLNLSDVGLLRYAYAKKTKGGKTHVIVAWTVGPFDVGALTAGGDQDAPGADIREAARPKGGVRLLSAGVEGAPYGTWVYDTKATRAEVLADLDRDMATLGWKPIVGVAEELKTGRGYSRPGRDVLVFTSEQEGSTIVSMIESRSER